MLLETVDVFVRSVLIGIMASVTVGPVAVLCIQRTLSKSRRAGIFSGLGVSCADTLLAMVAYFFYAILESQIAEYDLMLRAVGGTFVVAVGVYIFLQNPVSQIRRNRSGRGSDWQDFVSIFGLTLTSFIMVIPYILAFFAVFKITGDGTSEVSYFMRGGLICLGFFLGSSAWWTGLAFIINLFRRNFRPRHMLTINRVAGGIIGSLGVYTILSTVWILYKSSTFL